MTDQNQENSITPEEFKLKLLKNNFAKRCTAYEEEIADLQLQIAMLQQTLQEGSEQSMNAQPAPPAPPEAPLVEG